ncbi:TPA: hypothetical protein ACFOIE_000910 [Neisseria meningitidis]
MGGCTFFRRTAFVKQRAFEVADGNVRVLQGRFDVFQNIGIGQVIDRIIAAEHNVAHSDNGNGIGCLFVRRILSVHIAGI